MRMRLRRAGSGPSPSEGPTRRGAEAQAYEPVAASPGPFAGCHSGEAATQLGEEGLLFGRDSSEKSSIYSCQRGPQRAQSDGVGIELSAMGQAQRPAARLRRSSSQGQFELDTVFTLGSGSNANRVRWKSSTRLRQDGQSSRCVSTHASVSGSAPEARFRTAQFEHCSSAQIAVSLHPYLPMMNVGQAFHPFNAFDFVPTA